ncbi:MAG: shikimate kinase [Geoalkalibacter sp.]|uniref:shikimate kinase n=1 Tax=Geoalkalibacter sp. TaxID=3041440 RepID=UPI003D146ABA
MEKKRDNVVLVGMPGAGKSTVGVVLAKRLGFDFIDTDLLIQRRIGRHLQEIIANQGLEGFKKHEEQVLLALCTHESVISTGGSAVYSGKGMGTLKSLGVIVFLDVPLADLQQRIHDMDSRGLVIDPGQTLGDLYRQRRPLYLHYADLHIDTEGLNVEETAARIAEQWAALQS